MKYREFVDWCNRRACDGCWDLDGAVLCLAVMEAIDSYPFWKRNKVWKEDYEQTMIECVIKPIHKKMLEYGTLFEEEKKLYNKLLG